MIRATRYEDIDDLTQNFKNHKLKIHHKGHKGHKVCVMKHINGPMISKIGVHKVHIN